jgi:dienelactone hydrolase
MRRAFVCVLLALASSADAAPKDGAILETKPYDWPAYDQLGAAGQGLVAEPAYRAMVAEATVEMSRIVYASDGLRVAAIACKPKAATAAAPKPLLLWLHGGAGERSKIGVDNGLPLLQIRRFCASGYVVLAPQYRGIDGGEGRDEVGGRDLDDVLALIPLGRGLPYVDGAQVFAFGFSRGALMALQAIRVHAPIAAVALVGAGGELAPTLERVPEFAKLVPPEAKTPSGLEQRSPSRWVDSLTDVPILFLHGADDPAVPAATLAALAAKLAEKDGIYEVHIYAREDHALFRHTDEVFERSLDWFRNVRKRSGAGLFDRLARAGDAGAAASRLRDLRQREPARWDFSERDLNFLGYTYLAQRRLSDAVALFQLVADFYPRSSNAWDSLGEAYEAAARKPDALGAYTKALALDPKADHARKRLAELRP